MSIDAVVVGVYGRHGEQFKLTLDRRDPRSPPGQSVLTVLNDGIHFAELLTLIGCELWGNSTSLMIGDEQIAIREGYTLIRLESGWQCMVDRWRTTRKVKT